MNNHRSHYRDAAQVRHIMFDNPEWVIYRVVWISGGVRRSKVFEDKKEAEDFHGGCRLLKSCTYASIARLEIDVNSKVLTEQWRCA